MRSVLSGRNLMKLALIYGTDKWGVHWYARHYQQHLRSMKYRRIRLLEIGVGGYDKPCKGGHSLRMWKRYFPFGRIYSIDIYDKSILQERRIRIFQGSQADRGFLEKVTEETGTLDVIIDDGSHINEHVIETFRMLFPKLKDGGVYVIEDTQTSYWPDYGGDSGDLKNAGTLMNYFKSLVDGLNHKEFLIPDYDPDDFDQKIISMHFYHNLIFIHKGNNDEPSTHVHHDDQV